MRIIIAARDVSAQEPNGPMKITIENTNTIVQLFVDGREIPARVWVGHTESGIPVQMLVTHVAVERSERQEEFQTELLAGAARRWSRPWPSRSG